MSYSFQLDPSEILGIAPTASLQEIRDAFRAKSKTYHPDRGGDAWAFRVVNRAHELMMTARVAGRVSEEARAEPRSSAEKVNPFAPIHPEEAGSTRSQKHDRSAAAEPPLRTVSVELLIIRFEVENPMALLIQPGEHRNLSCSVNVSWPGPAHADDPARLPIADEVIEALSAAFDAAGAESRPDAVRSDREEDKFAGWLTFASVPRAEDGFKALRNALAKARLGVDRSVREVTIPRTWAKH